MSHENSDLEVRAMTNDVQYQKGMTAQGNAEHVQSNDAVELARAWHGSLSRRLGPRMGVTVRTSIFASDVLEHDRFRVRSLQHLQKLPSHVSVILIYHFDL